LEEVKEKERGEECGVKSKNRRVERKES
jgi:hypothetical protein